MVACLADPAMSASMHGAWVPVNQARTPEDMAKVVQSLLDHKVTDIFVDGLNNGKAYFPSQTHTSVGGQLAQGPDLIGAALDAANGKAKIHAWLEYGLIAQYGTQPTLPFAMNASKQGWILGADSGGFLWMDGRKSGVQSWLCGVIADVSKAHPQLASIQLDDHFALPASLVGNNQQAAMTTLAKSLSTCSRGVELSLSPATLDFAKNNTNVDWALWSASPATIPFSTYYPQIYRSTFKAFQTEYQATMKRVKGVGSRWLPGLRVAGAGNPTPWNEVKSMLTATEKKGGAVVWYAAGITQMYAQQFCQTWGCTGKQALNMTDTIFA